MVLGLTPDQWADLAISAGIIIGTAIVGRWVIYFVLRRVLGGLTDRTRFTLDNVVLESLRPPIYWLILVLAINGSIARLDFIPQAWELRLDGVYFFLYLCVGYLAALRLVTRLIDWYGEEIAPSTEIELDEDLIPFFRRVGMILLTLVGLIMLLEHLNVDVSGLVATLGVGSLAVALAARDVLGDTISGFIIMVDRPFRIGDRIEIQDLNTWGDVVDIGIRSSRIRTRDNRMVIVPNSVIGKSLIVNHSFPSSQYRIQVHVGVAYGSDVELARKIMIEAVRKVDGVLPNRKVEALFLEFGDSALIFRVRWWIESYVDTRRMFDRVNTAIYRALGEAGVEIPNPQLDVHHKMDTNQVAQLLKQLRTVE